MSAALPGVVSPEIRAATESPACLPWSHANLLMRGTFLSWQLTQPLQQAEVATGCYRKPHPLPLLNAGRAHPQRASILGQQHVQPSILRNLPKKVGLASSSEHYHWLWPLSHKPKETSPPVLLQDAEQGQHDPLLSSGDRDQTKAHILSKNSYPNKSMHFPFSCNSAQDCCRCFHCQNTTTSQQKPTARWEAEPGLNTDHKKHHRESHKSKGRCQALFLVQQPACYITQGQMAMSHPFRKHLQLPKLMSLSEPRAWVRGLVWW